MLPGLAACAVRSGVFHDRVERLAPFLGLGGVQVEQLAGQPVADQGRRWSSAVMAWAFLTALPWCCIPCVFGWHSAHARGER
jgi:hypothetical protein